MTKANTFINMPFEIVIICLKHVENLSTASQSRTFLWIKIDAKMLIDSRFFNNLCVTLVTMKELWLHLFKMYFYFSD